MRDLYALLALVMLTRALPEDQLSIGGAASSAGAS